MCETVEHCYEGGSKTVVDRYHSSNNLGTGPALCQYCNVYWVLFSTLCYSIYIVQYQDLNYRMSGRIEVTLGLSL